MRAALGYENTFKNTVKSMILPYTKNDTSKTFKEIITNYRTYLNQQKDIDFCKKEANGVIGLYNKLDEAPSFEEKQNLLAFMENIHSILTPLATLDNSFSTKTSNILIVFTFTAQEQSDFQLI